MGFMSASNIPPVWSFVPFHDFIVQGVAILFQFFPNKFFRIGPSKLIGSKPILIKRRREALGLTLRLRLPKQAV